MYIIILFLMLHTSDTRPKVYAAYRREEIPTKQKQKKRTSTKLFICKWSGKKQAKQARPQFNRKHSTDRNTLTHNS